MKIVGFSDTHSFHNKIVIPECDIGIFAGDFSKRGSKKDTESFFDWYSRQEQCRYKILIYGNHDICFEKRFDKETGADKWLTDLLKKYDNLIILNNSSVEIENIKIWGSPATPWFHGEYWAFNYKDDIKGIWEKIPNDIDIIVTHGPAHSILDTNYQGLNTGCKFLSNAIKQIRPRYHICGHIHEARGIEEKDGIYYINASILTNIYEVYNKPIEFNY